MPRKTVTLGEYEFSSKKEAKELYSSILNGTGLGQPLEGDNFSYVMALLLNHPKSKEKIGKGIQSIIVNQGAYSNNRCFHVVRTDGSVEDFSIGKCIDGDHSDFHKFCIACRKTVDKEIRIYKRNYFNENSDSDDKVKCQISGVKISFDEAHVDHREPFTFSSIVHFFIQANNIDLKSIVYVTTGKYGNEFSDQSIIDSFKKWHKDNAKLRITTGKTNLSKGYLGRIKTTKADGKLS